MGEGVVEERVDEPGTTNENLQSILLPSGFLTAGPMVCTPERNNCGVLQEA